jgi:hypothetical protein
MEMFFQEFFTSLSPELQLPCIAAVIVVSSVIGALEAFCECKLHRRAPWGNLCSWGEKRKSPR